MTESAQNAKAGLAIRPANNADTAGLAKMLARAFARDPFACWLVSRHPAPDEAMAQAFALQLEHLALPGELVFCTEDGSGAALWSAPGAWDLSWWRQLQFAPSFARVVTWRQLWPAWRAISRVQEAHPRVPHYYLQVLGVEPDRQGCGQGKALLAPMLARADREQTPVYLETAAADNLAYYRRFGFEEQTSLILPAGAPPLWTMLREPGSAPL